MRFERECRWKSSLLALAAAAAVAASGAVVLAQSHTGSKGGGHSPGTTHDDGHSSHDGGKGAKGGKSSQAGRSKGGGHKSLRDVFSEMEDEAKAETEAKGKKGPARKGGSSEIRGKGSTKAEATDTKGKKPTAKAAEDSDRPAWAGTKGPGSKPGRPNLTPGVKKGTIYGDMYVIVRDANGVPILDANGYVQVYYVNSAGVLTCCIPRDAEGNLLPTLADGTAVVPIEVELGRLSVGRSPTRVLSAQLDEAIKSINTATSIKLDAAGRIVLVAADGTTKTIDSPLENLALYVELINTGTIAGIDPTKLAAIGIVADGTLSLTEYKLASSFFAAASDKTIAVTIDSIAYMNAILKIDGTLPGDYVDYSTFVYDREAVYKDLTVTILVTTDGGTTWVSKTVNVYETVFASKDLDATNIAGFTAAADDARTVINYIHEYSVPVVPTSQ